MSAAGNINLAQDSAVHIGILALVDSHVAEVPAAFEGGVYGEDALVGAVHGCPDIHVRWQRESLGLHFQAMLLAEELDGVWDMGAGGVFGKENCEIVVHLPWNRHLVFATPFAIAVKQLEYVAEHSGGIGSVDFFHNEKIVLIGILHGLNVCFKKRTRYKLVRDVRFQFTERLVEIALIPSNRLEASDELRVCVVRVERHAADITFRKTFPGLLV